MARLTLLVFFCAATLAAATNETAYYVDGPAKAIAPHTQGTLVLADQNGLTFQAGNTNLAVPYQSITKAELGAVRSKDSGAFYKVWRLPKRLRQAKTRYLTVSYTEQNQPKTLVFELEQQAAGRALDTLDVRTGKRSAVDQVAGGTQAEDWWGDQYWKTTRNAGKWSKPSTVSTAPNR